MKKRVLSALLAAALTLSLACPALAVTSRDDAAQALAALDIMTGDENGDLNLSAPVTRAEFVKMLMAASPISVGDVTYVSPYPDVPASHWAAPYVEAAVAAGYVTGYLDGTFRPANTITLAEGVVMALRLLGYTNEDFSGSFPAGQMAMYRTLDLDEGITIGQNDTMKRHVPLLQPAHRPHPLHRAALPLLRAGLRPHRRRRGGHPGPPQRHHGRPRGGGRGRLAGQDSL